MSKTNYQITVGYTAVIQIDVKANSEKEAKEIGLAMVEKQKQKFVKKDFYIADDCYRADGIVDMDNSWNQL